MSGTLWPQIATNPVGASQVQQPTQQYVSQASPYSMPAVDWGGYPVPQRLYNAAQGAIGNALGWVGGTEAPGIRAFHGSPYDFNAFDASKIGTGEGAQAYGHGLYFAGNESVAQQYRDQLRWKGANWDDPQVIAQNAIDRAGGDRVAAATNLKNSLDSTTNFYRGKVPPAQAVANQNTAQAVDLLRGAEPITGRPPTSGKMYEVNLNVQPQQLLDWDKPLSEQPAAAQIAPLIEQNANRVLNAASFGSTRNAAKDALLALRSGNMTGEGAYRALGMGQSKLGNLPNPSVASQTLQQAGIPGIQYLDQGSRAAGEGTRNYVMFDPNLIQILRKYLAPFMTGAAAVPLAGRQQQ